MSGCNSDVSCMCICMLLCHAVDVTLGLVSEHPQEPSLKGGFQYALHVAKVCLWHVCFGWVGEWGCCLCLSMRILQLHEWNILFCLIPPPLTGCPDTCSDSPYNNVHPLMDHDRVWTAVSPDGSNCLLKLVLGPYPTELHLDLAKVCAPAFAATILPKPLCWRLVFVVSRISRVLPGGMRKAALT